MSKNREKNSRLVYSSETGRICSLCSYPAGECTCNKKQGNCSSDGVVRVGRETKGRKGKGVTTVTGVSLEHDELKNLAQQLKRKCGTGGTLKEGIIEIQGDHRNTLIKELQNQGWTVKRTGG